MGRGREERQRPDTICETTGARDGNRTHDPSLTKTVRYRCATRANHYPTLRVVVGSGGFEPPKLSQLIYSQSHLATLVTAQVEEHASLF